MNETLNLRTLANLRGCRVLSSDDVELGRLIEILYDSSSEIPVWLGVAPSRGLRFDTLLAPAVGAMEHAGALQLRYTSEMVRKQPPTDHGEGFASAGDERRLYRFFALPFNEGIDLRVLHPGDDLPGSESVF
ncbi:MAG TPA: hypothetical protein VFY10_07525 [Dehalococcoidia bacterium]|nr:hypothetical protein [Dehalococcoidia bacterium]